MLSFLNGVNWTKIQDESRKINHHEPRISFYLKKFKRADMRRAKRTRPREQAMVKARSQV